MRVHTLLFVCALAGGSSCAGCSEECSGDNLGAAGCPCSTDQDCTTTLGSVLLCVEGTCGEGDPPAAAQELGACDAEGQCGDGRACGIDDVCFAAPRCQRIGVDLVFRLAAEEAVDGGPPVIPSGAVATSVDDCSHTWSATAPEASFEAQIAAIALDGAMELEGCEQGHWYAADRVGELVCDGVTWAVAPADVVTCVGDCDAPCRLARDGTGDAESVGVCP